MLDKRGAESTMGFFEDIAQALDNEGIESRVHGDTLFVPVSEDVEVQFELIDALPGVNSSAANVFVALADVSEEDEDFDAALVGVVFTPEDAVEAVAKHMATNEVITWLTELLDGSDPRVEDLEFEQDGTDPLLLHAQLSEFSLVEVKIHEQEYNPVAAVNFSVLPKDVLELAESIAAEIFAEEGDEEDPVKLDLLDSTLEELRLQHQEILELGTFQDLDRLLDVLAYTANQALDWEELLVALDDGSTDPFFEWVELEEGQDGGGAAL